MDQKSLALYIPITSKSVSAEVYEKFNEKLETLGGTEQYHITGLPLAEDVFGIDMFIQMAISAPLAMLFIFILILYFFKNAIVGASALAVAMASVLITMGAFVAFGNTIHIMSSMIAIFLMPIAVLDATHILSMFFDKYQQTKDRKNTLIDVMKTLFRSVL
jgi:predicted RND superfamily exporter protein